MPFQHWPRVTAVLLAVAIQAVAANDEMSWREAAIAAGAGALRQQLGDAYDSVVVKAVTADVANPCVRQTPVIGRSIAITSTPAPRMAARTEVACPGGRVKSMVVWYSVSAMAAVVVAGRDLSVGEALNPQDVQAGTQDLARLRGSPLHASTIERGAYRVKTPVRKGQALLASAVEPAPAIEAGHTVLATYRSGGMVLRFSGIAMRDASIGGFVPVQRPGATDALSARVSAPGEVELLP